MYRDRYQKILADRPADEGALLRGDRHRPVLRRYYEYIEAQLDDVKAKLSAFG